MSKVNRKDLDGIKTRSELDSHYCKKTTHKVRLVAETTHRAFGKNASTQYRVMCDGPVTIFNSHSLSEAIENLILRLEAWRRRDESTGANRQYRKSVN